MDFSDTKLYYYSFHLGNHEIFRRRPIDIRYFFKVNYIYNTMLACFYGGLTTTLLISPMYVRVWDVGGKSETFNF